MTEKFTEADPTGAKRFLAALPQAYNEPGHRRTGHGPNPRAETIAADPENKWAMNQTLVLQRRFLNLVSFGAEIASRKARPQSCQARGQVAMKRSPRALSCEPSL